MNGREVMTENMSFRAVGDESHVSLVRDISLSLNMTYIYLSLQAKRSNDSFSKINKNISNYY